VYQFGLSNNAVTANQDAGCNNREKSGESALPSIAVLEKTG
jgi:hypothetical protein